MNLFACIASISLTITLVNSEQLGQELEFLQGHRDLQSSTADFCWRGSYWRGVGKPLSGCPDGKEKVGALCYEKCPSGYQRKGVDCHQSCSPSDKAKAKFGISTADGDWPEGGYKDEGLFCRPKREDGMDMSRGTFSVKIKKVKFCKKKCWNPKKWKVKFETTSAKEMCEKEKGDGNCEMCLGLARKKCHKIASHLKQTGVCTCKPKCKGYGDEVLGACTKKISVGKNPTPLICKGKRVEDGGLCYRKCTRHNTKGVGPLCIYQTPEHWVGCGFGAARDDLACGMATTGQITGPVRMAIFVATLGLSSTAETAAAPAKAGTFAHYVQTYFQYAYYTYYAVSTIGGLSGWVMSVEEAIRKDKKNGDITHVDANRLMFMLIGILDPTAVTAVAGAYLYDTCDKVKDDDDEEEIEAPDAELLEWKDLGFTGQEVAGSPSYSQMVYIGTSQSKNGYSYDVEIDTTIEMEGSCIYAATGMLGQPFVSSTGSTVWTYNFLTMGWDKLDFLDGRVSGDFDVSSNGSRLCYLDRSNMPGSLGALYCTSLVTETIERIDTTNGFGTRVAMDTNNNPVVVASGVVYRFATSDASKLSRVWDNTNFTYRYNDVAVDSNNIIWGVTVNGELIYDVAGEAKKLTVSTSPSLKTLTIIASDDPVVTTDDNKIYMVSEI